MVAHTISQAFPEVEAGRQQVQSQPWVHMSKRNNLSRKIHKEKSRLEETAVVNLPLKPGLLELSHSSGPRHELALL